MALVKKRNVKKRAPKKRVKLVIKKGVPKESRVRKAKAKATYQKGRSGLIHQFGSKPDATPRTQKITPENVPFIPGHTYARGTSGLTRIGLGAGMSPVIGRGTGRMPRRAEGGGSNQLGKFKVFKKDNDHHEIPLSGSSEIIERSGGINYIQKPGYYGMRPYVDIDNRLQERSFKRSLQGGGIGSWMASMLTKEAVKGLVKTGTKAAARMGVKAVSRKAIRAGLKSVAKRAGKTMLKQGKKFGKKVMKTALKESTKAALDMVSGRKQLNKKNIAKAVKQVQQKTAHAAARHVAKTVKKKTTSRKKKIIRKTTTTSRKKNYVSLGSVSKKNRSAKRVDNNASLANLEALLGEGIF